MLIEFTLPYLVDGCEVNSFDCRCEITVTYKGKRSTYHSPAEAPEWESARNFEVDYVQYKKLVEIGQKFKILHSWLPMPDDLRKRAEDWLATPAGLGAVDWAIKES